MKLSNLYRTIRTHLTLHGRTRPFQYRCFQHDFVPRDPNSKPVKYKYPDFYDPYGPRPTPSDKIVQLADKIASLSLEERMQIGPTLREKVMHPKLEQIAVEGVDLGTPRGGSSKVEEKKAEKTKFDVKLEKFDAAVKLKIIKEIRSFTDLGLKEAKELVEKAPVILKQQITKDEANVIIEKIKAVGGVAVME